jgi:hypothetical protein
MKVLIHNVCPQELEQVLYTLGGIENLLTAKRYYSSTIDLTGGKNTRALFGICLVRYLLLLLYVCMCVQIFYLRMYSYIFFGVILALKFVV